MPLDIIQQEIYTDSINILLSLSPSAPYLATSNLSLHRIGCKHIPSCFAFTIVLWKIVIWKPEDHIEWKGLLGQLNWKRRRTSQSQFKNHWSMQVFKIKFFNTVIKNKIMGNMSTIQKIHTNEIAVGKIV